MIPWELLDTAELPDGGGQMTLHRRGDEYVIRIDGQDLMSSRQFSSERELARQAIERLRVPSPRILIGGLGLGFTAAAALEASSDAQILVAELFPAVHRWNLEVLGSLAGDPLEDRRVEVEVCDVCELIRQPSAPYDAILLDVDNGPEGLTRSTNQWLYDKRGLGASLRALNPGGILGVWSAFDDPQFTKRARSAGFEVEIVRVRSRGKKGSRHTLWFARRA